MKLEPRTFRNVRAHVAFPELHAKESFTEQKNSFTECARRSYAGADVLHMLKFITQSWNEKHATENKFAKETHVLQKKLIYMHCQPRRRSRYEELPLTLAR